MKEDKKKRVKQQRAKLKENPSRFLKEEVINPTIKFWKEEPLRAIWTFTIWVTIYYIAFGGIQAINNDMIYCDATIDQYDGKLMYTFNEFVKYYNEEAQQMQRAYTPIGIENQERLVENFNEQYKMYCTYNITRWIKEPIWLTKESMEAQNTLKERTNYCDQINGCTTGHLETIGHALYKILLKRS